MAGEESFEADNKVKDSNEVIKVNSIKVMEANNRISVLNDSEDKREEVEVTSETIKLLHAFSVVKIMIFKTVPNYLTSPLTSAASSPSASTTISAPTV